MTKRILVFLLVVGMSLCLIPAARAYGYAYGEKTSTVDIYVGYFGNTYAYIGTVTEDEMQNNCECGEWIYSSIDRGSRTRHNVAYGVTMESLLGYVGIDVDSIDLIYFLGTDDDYYAGFKDLFATRYYFPYLADGFNYQNPANSNRYLILSDYEPVPAILAFRDSLRQDAQVDGPFDVNEYRSWMNDENCLRIVFGQQVWDEVATSDSVKCVYEIAVRLTGSPITTEDVELDYGSGSVPLSYYYNVETGYEELNELIRNGLKIWSEDPEIVQWNEEDGTITALQEGVGRIMIEYEDGGEEFLETVTVTVSDRTTNGDGTNVGNNTDENDDTGSSGNQENPDNPGNVYDPEVLENPEDSGDAAPPETLEDQNRPDKRDELATGVGSGTGSGSGGGDSGMGGTSQGNGFGAGDITTGTGSGSGMLSADGSGNPDLKSAGEDVSEEGLTQQADSDRVSDAGNSQTSVYLALGNLSGGDVVGSGGSGGGISGGSGGKAIELEEWPIRYTVILLVILAVVFLGGGTVRLLRFRRDTAER